LKWSHAFKWLAYPAAYLVYALLRGSIEGFFPYFFIDVKQLGPGRVAINCAGMLLVFVITGLLFIFIGKKMSGRNKIA
jgi:hypothetical protein